MLQFLKKNQLIYLKAINSALTGCEWHSADHVISTGWPLGGLTGCMFLIHCKELGYKSLLLDSLTSLVALYHVFFIHYKEPAHKSVLHSNFTEFVSCCLLILAFLIEF